MLLITFCIDLTLYLFCPCYCSICQEFIVKLDDETATVTNYTGGEAAGSSWADKVMSFKTQQETPEELGDGAGDDEWVGNLHSFDLLLELKGK